MIKNKTLPDVFISILGINRKIELNKQPKRTYNNNATGYQLHSLVKNFLNKNPLITNSLCNQP